MYILILLQKDRKFPRVSDAEIATLHETILYIDDDVIALNKPPGLAVQGGTGIKNSVDAMLGALKFDKAERPKLVHRLDKDTSGVLLLGRSSSAAAQLSAAFRAKYARKVYWAIVVGSVELSSGRIDLPLSKLSGQKGERMVPDFENGKRAVTFYRTIERVSRKVAWLSLEPQTGRTHQLRVHMEALGTPILGDSFRPAPEVSLHLGDGKLHMRRRRIVCRRDSIGKACTKRQDGDTGTIPDHAPAPDRHRRAYVRKIRPDTLAPRIAQG